MAGDWVFLKQDGSATTPTDPAGSPTWKVRQFNGLPANHLNPQHFVRFTDVNGNPCPVILNGRGAPANVYTQFGYRRSVDATDDTIAAYNQVLAAMNAAGASAIAASIAAAPDSTASRDAFDDMVTAYGNLAAATFVLSNLIYPIDDLSASSDQLNDSAQRTTLFAQQASAGWDTPQAMQLASNALISSDTTRSISADFLTVNSGALSTGTGTGTNAHFYTFSTPATRHVEKYFEVDFLLLGVPVTF